MIDGRLHGQILMVIPRAEPAIRTSSLSTDITNPYAQAGDPSHFQCVPGTETLPLAQVQFEPINSYGGQTPGIDCNVIPHGSISGLG